jgi:tetratricopeptide (TPR) repeat protein
VPVRWLALIALAAAATPARAQPNARQDAAAHFARGEQAQAQGRYREAITEYEQAYAIAPHPFTLYNIAVCYEALGDAAAAADHYERYLDGAGPTAGDADEVRAKIRALRPVATTTTTPPTGDPWPSDGGESGGVIGRFPPPAPPVVRPAPRWSAGLSYGLGFGDVPVQRFSAFGTYRVIPRVELGGVLGVFGKNDRGLGGLARVTLSGAQPQPFARAALTLGYARQDASSSAETRLPIAAELGGGVQLGRGGRIELGFVVRWLRGGWDAASTTADSYVNDDVAIAIDLGVALDFPVTLPVKATAR